MVNEPLNVTPGPWADAFLSTHADYIKTMTESVESRVGPASKVSAALLEGHVPQALCAEAEACEADLIVMSTHGHGGFTRMWLGSVSDAVLRHSSVPVLLVRQDENWTDDLDARVTIRHIVVPLDGSALGEAALQPALDLGGLFDASYTLLRTIAYPVMISPYMPDTVQDNSTLLDQLDHEARAYLDIVRAKVDDGSRRVETKVVISQGPAAGVVEYVETSGADFVVMASHNRHGVARLALGSIADKVMRGSHTPVLIIHPAQEELSVHSEHVAKA
jgi:nucleotide-binding universal stress UspA family protein